METTIVAAPAYYKHSIQRTKLHVLDDVVQPLPSADLANSSYAP